MSNILNTTSRTHRFASSRIQPGVIAPGLTTIFPARCNRIVCAITAWWVPFHE
jgi:hypothetical protein